MSEQKRYRAIVADPPWEQPGGPGFDGRGHASRVKRNATRPLPYPTMSLAEIAALPIGDLAEADAHLYLWVTNRYVRHSYALVEGWGFSPSTLLTWAKAPMGLGLGGAYVQTTEHILFARRGSLSPLRRTDRTCWQWRRPYNEAGKPAHSRKPDGFLDVVEQVSPGPYVELFSRRARLGWDTWGDQSLGTAEMPETTRESA